MPLRVCCYEDRPDAVPSLVFMGESLCRVDSTKNVLNPLHLPKKRLPTFASSFLVRENSTPELVGFSFLFLI